MESHILYHKSRYAGARYAVPKGQEKEIIEAVGTARITRYAEAIWKNLEMWSAATMNATQARDMLQKILYDTVALDLQMQQQKAFFSLTGATEFSRAPNGLQYEPANMEIRHGKVSNSGRPQNMCLLITPLLVKWGKSDGTDYGTSLVMERAQVDIEVPSSGSGRKIW